VGWTKTQSTLHFRLTLEPIRPRGQWYPGRWRATGSVDFNITERQRQILLEALDKYSAPPTFTTNYMSYHHEPEKR
jgi:hypothetical protein